MEDPKNLTIGYLDAQGKAEEALTGASHVYLRDALARGTLRLVMSLGFRVQASMGLGFRL